MSKKFEEEYKEYLNSQAPDLWGRIEAGVDAFEAEKKVVPIQKGKKRQIRYQHYRTLVTAAACLFALLLVVPVYLLVKPVGKGNEAADMSAPMILTDATIENIEVPAQESAPQTEESASVQEQVEEAAPEAIASEAEAETEELQMETTDVTQEEILQEEYSEDGTELAVSEMNDEMLPEENTIITEEEPEEHILEEVAEEETATEGTAEETTEEAAEGTEEESAAAQEDMEVIILSQDGKRENGMAYTATVAGDESGATIMLLVPEDSGIVFEEGKKYCVTIEISADIGSYAVVGVKE